MLSRVYSIMASRTSDGLAAAHGSSFIIVNVRFGSHQTMYELDRLCTVEQLRRKLSEDHAVPLSEVKVALGGSILADDLTIEESGVGMQSMLFAIRTTPAVLLPISATVTGTISEKAATVYSTATCMETTSAGATASHEHSDGGYSRMLDQYFVYCKLCGDVRPGRLRVKCSVCGDGAVLVERGPGSWADVLTPGRVKGRCGSLHCENCVPNFYFKCVTEHPGSVGGTAVALYHIRPNRRCVPCITCADIMNPVMVFPCQASHVMCLRCFMEYCKVRLHERRFTQNEQFGYTLPCPAGCPNSYVQEQHHFCIMGRAEYERYKDFAAEECLMSAGGVYCPQSVCGLPFMVDTPGSRVICPQCHFIFCRYCRRLAHDGHCEGHGANSEPSQDFSNPEQAERAQWERQTARIIDSTTKGCPGCGTRTERDGGCMHMQCFCCGAEWCWLCVKPWDRQCQSAHWFG